MTSSIVDELRNAIYVLRMRGLKESTKFVSELLLGLPSCLRNQTPRRTPPATIHTLKGIETNQHEDYDRLDAAMASFDSGEYLRTHHLLTPSINNSKPIGHATRFLYYYSRYLAGEKKKEEMDLQTSVSTDKTRLSNRNGHNPYLKELFDQLQEAYRTRDLDGAGLYLFAVVLKRLGYLTVTGKIQSEESDQDQTTRSILIRSLQLYPYNWSAWMELALLAPFTSKEEELLSGSCPWMFDLFQVHVLLDQQQNEAAQKLLLHLQQMFPHSSHLLSQQALVSYHMRDFDTAQEQFQSLTTLDPYRLETMDVYSNVLYVKEDKIELSRLAHRVVDIEKYRPESCCIIGNYYSLKQKHTQAIVYFTRALKLNPHFVSAWTLIGHEYVEMKNTSAAIEAYQHAVTLYPRDYRAWYGLGQAYEILNMYLYSMYYYKKATMIRPLDARMWCALGSCLEKLAKPTEAILCFERAVGNQDYEGMATYQLGRMYSQQGALERAAEYYQQYLGIEAGGEMVRVDTPQAVTAVLFLANYYKQTGFYTRATIFCTRLLDLQGPEKEEAKALLRELRSLEANSV